MGEHVKRNAVPSCASHWCWLLADEMSADYRCFRLSLSMSCARSLCALESARFLSVVCTLLFPLPAHLVSAVCTFIFRCLRTLFSVACIFSVRCSHAPFPAVSALLFQLPAHFLSAARTLSLRCLHTFILLPTRQSSLRCLYAPDSFICMLSLNSFSAPSSRFLCTN